MDPQREIPYGPYCYTGIGYDRETRTYKARTCPYWSINPNHPHQMNGYCSYMKTGDWMEEGLSLLWDKVKECGINE